MKKITLRISDEEWATLTAYAQQVERSQNEIGRELIRSLKKKLKTDR